MFFRLKAKLTAVVFTLMAMAAMTAHAQQPLPTPNLDGGPYGKTPAGKPDQAVTNKVNPEKVKDKDKPKILDCDEPYEVEITLLQEGDCAEGFNFSKLRQKAKQMADQALAEVTCPMGEKCIVPSTWYGYWSWGCKDATHAMVQVTEFKTCQEPNTKVSNGVGDGSHMSSYKPGTLGGPPPKDPAGNGEYITVNVGTGNDGAVNCGVSFLVSYVCEFQNTPAAAILEPLQKNGTKPPAGVTIQNFQTFYDQAYAKARSYHDSFQCADPAKCKLTPFGVVSGNLQADGGAETVTITLYFWVQCKS